MIYRIYVEKKPEFAVSAKKIKSDIKNVLNIKVGEVREILRYDVEGITKEQYEKLKVTVFSEPPIDNVFDEEIDIPKEFKVFAIEFLPGQYDQRADSAAQCAQLLTQAEKPYVRCARVIAISGVNDSEFESIKKYLINPVEAREASFLKPLTLVPEKIEADKVAVVENFISFSEAEIENYHAKMGFAMTVLDLKFVQEHFRKEKRNPTITELKVIDTYWSDHCRHTTFLTHLNDVKIDSENSDIKKAYDLYVESFDEIYKGREDKYHCLMDIAVIAAKALKKQGYLRNLDESDEINACSIVVPANIDGKTEDWLIQFKNETHNHPTEIEPFGGAATCLGGAIRDPLSGRSYVFQAMRITGSADPTVSVKDTLKGKLPQRVISKTACAGFSSYGNQIGLATGQVVELYHDNYVAKRLETGYVVGASPKKNVVRMEPLNGDVVILLGGETGRDGCGGATGSSKAHTLSSVETCGAEVQKGNPLTERKIQRLFKKEEVTKLIKRCNDFGAGGVCVAIGELADGLDIFLDNVPKKYDGLDGTELAISESQERMAVVICKEDVEKFIAYANEENLTATLVAEVKEEPRMRMFLKGEKIVDIPREFLNTNGVKQTAKAIIEEKVSQYADSVSDEYKKLIDSKNYEELGKKVLSKLNVGSQKGLSEIFDSTIGAKSVYMPFGGKNQSTPAIAMAAKIPTDAKTDTTVVSSFGYNPDLMSTSAFTGSIYSIVTSLSKLVACGVDRKTAYLTLQEFFMRLKSDPKRWGQPLAAILGAFYAQMNLKVGAIGGKDSMSGTFEDIDVPPTLISFAIGISKAQDLITNVLKNKDEKLYLIKLPKNENGIFKFEQVLNIYDKIYENIQNKNITFATVVEEGGVFASIAKSCFGNDIGFKFNDLKEDLFKPQFGNIVVNLKSPVAFDGIDIIEVGNTLDAFEFIFNNDIKVSGNEFVNAFNSKLLKVYPQTAEAEGEAKNISFIEENKTVRSSKLQSLAKPRVFIPVFPGTNCEYDTANAFKRAGAQTDIFVIKNRSPKDIEESVNEIAKRIKNSQIIAFPGGFSGGDEPDGSGKFFATTFRNPIIKEQVMALLKDRDGLIIGICNGFQTLIKLGLVPYGEIVEMSGESPTLTYNKIGRHVSTIVETRVASNKSPWLSECNVGDVFKAAVSHGEGRFVASDLEIKKLIENGQIATQYVDSNHNATMVSPFNPNGSMYAIEGITSPCGKVFGKMAHIERIGENNYINVEGNYDMKVFESGVKYFK